MPTSVLDTNCRIWSFLCGDDDEDDDDDADDSKHVVYGGLPARGHKGLGSGGPSAGIPNSDTQKLTWDPDIQP